MAKYGTKVQDKSRPDYKYYGGRGITVCERWKDFIYFLEDMGDKPKGMSLERIENNKGYSKNNCKWATKDEQMQNTRGTRLISFNGESLGLNAWARKMGLCHSSLQGRLNRGWSIEKALSTPKRKENRI